MEGGKNSIDLNMVGVMTWQGVFFFFLGLYSSYSHTRIHTAWCRLSCDPTDRHVFVQSIASPPFIHTMYTRSCRQPASYHSDRSSFLFSPFFHALLSPIGIDVLTLDAAAAIGPTRPNFSWSKMCFQHAKLILLMHPAAPNHCMTWVPRILFVCGLALWNNWARKVH